MLAACYISELSTHTNAVKDTVATVATRCTHSTIGGKAHRGAHITIGDLLPVFDGLVGDIPQAKLAVHATREK